MTATFSLCFHLTSNYDPSSPGLCIRIRSLQKPLLSAEDAVTGDLTIAARYRMRCGERTISERRVVECSLRLMTPSPSWCLFRRLEKVLSSLSTFCPESTLASSFQKGSLQDTREGIVRKTWMCFLIHDSINTHKVSLGARWTHRHTPLVDLLVLRQPPSSSLLM